MRCLWLRCLRRRLLLRLKLWRRRRASSARNGAIDALVGGQLAERERAQHDAHRERLSAHAALVNELQVDVRHADGEFNLRRDE